jgi:hypothetical protein
MFIMLLFGDALSNVGENILSFFFQLLRVPNDFSDNLKLYIHGN